MCTPAPAKPVQQGCANHKHTHCKQAWVITNEAKWHEWQLLARGEQVGHDEKVFKIKSKQQLIGGLCIGAANSKPSDCQGEVHSSTLKIVATEAAMQLRT